MEERKHVEILNPFIFCNFDLSPNLSLWIEMESANSSTATMLFSLSGGVMFFLNCFCKNTIIYTETRQESIFYG